MKSEAILIQILKRIHKKSIKTDFITMGETYSYTLITRCNFDN